MPNDIKSYRIFVEELEQDERISSFYSKEPTQPVLACDTFIKHLPLLNQSSEIPCQDRLINRPPIKRIIESTANGLQT